EPPGRGRPVVPAAHRAMDAVDVLDWLDVFWNVSWQCISLPTQREMLRIFCVRAPADAFFPAADCIFAAHSAGGGERQKCRSEWLCERRSSPLESGQSS